VAKKQASGETVNPDLQALHATLVEQVALLSKQVGRAKDAAAVRALVNEINELNHRVTQVGALLFARKTRRLANAVEKVRDAEQEVKAAIRKIDDVSEFLKTLSGFLALVDRAIRTAKLVMV